MFSKGSGDINVLKLFDIESFTMEREDITRKIVRGKFGSGQLLTSTTSVPPPQFRISD